MKTVGKYIVSYLGVNIVTDSRNSKGTVVLGGVAWLDTYMKNKSLPFKS